MYIFYCVYFHIMIWVNLHIMLQDGYTALILASQKGHKHIVELLIQSGAKLDIKSNVSERLMIIILTL